MSMSIELNQALVSPRTLGHRLSTAPGYELRSLCSSCRAWPCPRRRSSGGRFLEGLAQSNR